MKNRHRMLVESSSSSIEVGEVRYGGISEGVSLLIGEPSAELIVL